MVEAPRKDKSMHALEAMPQQMHEVGLSAQRLDSVLSVAASEASSTPSEAASLSDNRHEDQVHKDKTVVLLQTVCGRSFRSTHFCFSLFAFR